MPESSGAMLTDAVNWVVCPRCKQSPGQPCRTPAGVRRTVPHGERTIALTQHPEFQRDRYMVRSIRGASLEAIRRAFEGDG
jgi:hypothetical protein